MPSPKQPQPPPTDYAALTGRLATMIPEEFYGTPETDVEEALALLIYRYYEEKAANAHLAYEEVQRKKKSS